jgi:hypothetical protein
MSRIASFRLPFQFLMTNWICLSNFATRESVKASTLKASDLGIYYFNHSRVESISHQPRPGPPEYLAPSH